MSDIAELVQRLRAFIETSEYLMNPDGPEAADALEAQAKHILDLAVAITRLTAANVELELELAQTKNQVSDLEIALEYRNKPPEGE